MNRRIRVNGRLYEAAWESEKSKTRRVKAVLKGLDDRELADAWNQYCIWCDDPDSRVFPMGEFDQEFEEYSKFDVAEMVWNSNRSFNPHDNYFWYGNGGLVSGSRASAFDIIDLDTMAEDMVETGGTFGVDAVRGIL